MVPHLEVECLVQGVEILWGPTGEGVGQLRKPVQRLRDFVEVGWRGCQLGLSLIGVGLPVGDHVFELADPRGDLTSGGKRDVVGFQVEYLALKSPVEVGDFAVDLCQPGGSGGTAVVPVGLSGFQAWVELTADQSAELRALTTSAEVSVAVGTRTRIVLCGHGRQVP